MNILLPILGMVVMADKRIDVSTIIRVTQFIHVAKPWDDCHHIHQ